ncbi:hypothetical protein SLEP1_g19604 [Rubroshorea leprosula]|uniref:TLC domain-containing protein n=1 Tax=Rubroshorea leprosula TaxID=152421 RepID=A0AAV5JAI3_9ROSI|nr:hypothetical protein SLEP1_g19604 [Rubroshorea leprosula]
MESSQSIPNLPLFFSMFFFIYLMAYFLVFRNWSPKIRPEACSCLISIFHGTPAVFLATHAILSDPHRGFASPNTKTQALVIDYSIAYFLMDLLHYIVFYPRDVIFIGHHSATLFVFLTCRHLVFHGACAILSLLILAEVTSACQNAWTLASERRYDNEFAAKVYDFLSPYFYAFYTVVRGFLAPLFVSRMGAFYASGGADTVIPKWVWISWLLVVIMAISVSILWVSNLCLQLYGERKGKLQKKKN